MYSKMLSLRFPANIVNEPIVVNLGIEIFAETLVDLKVPVIHVNWRPPVQLEPDVLDALRKLSAGSSGNLANDGHLDKE